MNLNISRFFALLLLSCPIVSSAVELNGVGRRIPAPIFAEWGTHFSAQNPGTTIKYQAVNATEGIKQVKDGTADFADTDIPLSKEEQQKNGLAQFPYMLTAITPIVNLPGIFEGRLNLNGQILADIFLGKITKWDDAAIAASNPDLKLPGNPIVVVHRTADGGGTYTFSSYLAKASPEWKAKVGVGATLNWPVGVAAENLYAMGDYVKKTPYAIGYSEISYARKNKLSYVKLQNANGTSVSPHMGSVEEATNNVKWNAANGFCEALTDEPGAGSWPMASASYIVIRKTSSDIQRRLALLNFLGWGMRVGDMDLTSLDFMPMKRSILPQIRNSWNDTPLNLEGATVANAAQVKELQANGTPIIDARIPDEYEEGHIPQAILVYYAEKSAKSASFNPQQDSFDLSKLPANKNADIVFYCNAGPCWKGYKAAAAAVRVGYKKVHWFRGGLPEWKEKGYPVASSPKAATGK
jgi:phosphate transport system substrate-binding protein